MIFPTIALPLFVANVIAALPPPVSSSTAALAAPIPARPVDAPLDGLELHPERPQQRRLVAPAHGTERHWSGCNRGRVLAGIWNGAVGLARLGAGAVISAITGPILGALKTAAATVLVISQVVSYVTPWSVAVAASPATVTAGSGGTSTGKVDTGGGSGSSPPAVQDCATPSE